MVCPSCGADLPADARFCIECGADVGRAASTGATVQLPRTPRTAVPCPACGAANPDYAVYCVRCGHRLSEPPPAPIPTLGPDLGRSLARPAPLPQYVRRRRHARQGRGGAAGAIFLIGLGALLLLKLPFWPGILIVSGLTGFFSEAMRGRYASGLSSIVWTFGIAFLFMVPRLWWPGILVLAGISILIQMVQRSLGRP